MESHALSDRTPAELVNGNRLRAPLTSVYAFALVPAIFAGAVTSFILVLFSDQLWIIVGGGCAAALTVECDRSSRMCHCRRVTPKEPHVSGWKPDFLPAEDQFARQAGQLRSMVGQKVTAVWVAWNLEHDRWFADLPVVLQLQGSRQLEVCWEKFDDLSITWNTIDTAVTPQAWVEWPLEWRREALPPLASVVGSLVRELTASRFLFTTQNLDHPHDVSSTWLTNGLWIGTTAAGLHVFNALDENGVSSEPPLLDEQRDYRAI